MNSTKNSTMLPALYLERIRQHLRPSTGLIRFLRRVLVSLAPAVAVGAFAVPAARIERGGPGVGGEWLLIILVFIAFYYASGRREI